MAICYDTLNKFDCAIRYFNLCIQLKPCFEKAYLGACLSNLKINRYEVALDLIEKAIKIIENKISEQRKS